MIVRLFRTGMWVLLVTVIGLTGCVGVDQSTGTPAPNTALTQMAQQVESLRNELNQVIPTLTALNRALPVVTVTPPTARFQGEQTATSGQTVAPSSSVDATNEVHNSLIQVLPTGESTLTSAKITATPSPVIIASNSTPWIVSATSGPPGSPVLATQPLIGVNGRLSIPPPTPFNPADSILYQDDFARNRGWFTTSNTRYKLQFDKGVYRFTVAVLNLPVWSIRGIGDQDVRIEVDAAQLSGPASGYYGLVCRYVNEKNYDVLFVSIDGAFGIGKVINKDLRYLAFTNDFNHLLKLAGNRLRADCIGDTLTLYVDGVKVLETKDTEIAGGSAGLVVGNRDISGIDVLFDNYIVLKP